MLRSATPPPRCPNKINHTDQMSHSQRKLHCRWRKSTPVLRERRYTHPSPFPSCPSRHDVRARRPRPHAPVPVDGLDVSVRVGAMQAPAESALCHHRDHGAHQAPTRRPSRAPGRSALEPAIAPRDAGCRRAAPGERTERDRPSPAYQPPHRSESREVDAPEARRSLPDGPRSAPQSACLAIAVPRPRPYGDDDDWDLAPDGGLRRSEAQPPM